MGGRKYPIKLDFFRKENVYMEVKDRLRCDDKQWWIDITDLSKEFFGDIVQKVEVSNFYDYTEDEAINGAKAFIEKKKEDIKDKEINFDAENIRISFINGKTIEIWNSEWGGIRKILKGE